MIKYIALIIAAFLLTGCPHNDDIDLEQETVYSKTDCPQFTNTLSIEVQDYNSTHGTISWIDATKLEKFLKRKKEFNEDVKNINNK